MVDFIIAYAKILFAINFFVAGIWITAIMWFKAARLYDNMTRDNRFR